MENGTVTLRGLTTGDGTNFPWAEAPVGIIGTPPIRVADRDLPRRHGIIPGDDRYSGRLLTFVHHVIGDLDDPASAELRSVELESAWATSDTEEWLDVRVTGTPSEYSYLGKPRGADIALTLLNAGAVTAARCSFMATDPIRYGPEQSVAISMNTAGEGSTFPWTFPMVFSGGASSSGTGSAPNLGSTEVDWTATLSGPLTNPRLALSGTGLFVEVAATVAEGQTVVLDSRAGAILLNGEQPRPSWVGAGSVWWRLQPGANIVQLTADAGTGTAAVVWRSGWA